MLSIKHIGFIKSELGHDQLAG